jgi:hypothetical protein
MGRVPGLGVRGTPGFRIPQESHDRCGDKEEFREGRHFELEPDEETERLMVAHMGSWHEMRKAELLQLAEKLGCNIYLAAYLRSLKNKMELVFGLLGHTANNRAGV